MPSQYQLLHPKPNVSKQDVLSSSPPPGKTCFPHLSKQHLWSLSCSCWKPPRLLDLSHSGLLQTPFISKIFQLCLQIISWISLVFSSVFIATLFQTTSSCPVSCDGLWIVLLALGCLQSVLHRAAGRSFRNLSQTVSLAHPQPPAHFV